MPFRIRDTPTADVACEAAKAQALAEGWTVKTLVRVQQEANGDWIITLAVRAVEKAAS
jgi:hypothetical protein